MITQKLEQATKSKIYLIKKLDKAKEGIDDLKFQVVYSSFVCWLIFFKRTLVSKSKKNHCVSLIIIFCIQAA